MSTISTTSSNRRYADPRAAYIHVPFCRHRCGYCNFTLVAGRDDLIPQFLKALDLELSQLGNPRSIDTLFVGGGTPSHLEPRPLGELFGSIRHWLHLNDGFEFSMEANPLDVTPARIDVLQRAGVNRLSLGVQSFDDRWLRFLERDHRAEDIARAFTLARMAMPAVSLDLIYGVPEQTLEEWRNDLQRALQLEPEHVSVYGLTYERGTSFWNRLQRNTIQPCPEERERAMYELAIDVLSSAGYEHYEVSNFARPGFRCRHNEAYWNGCTYYAAGPGAARHIAGRREINHRSTTTYLRRMLSGQSPVSESEYLDPEEAARERFIFALRRLAGVNTKELAEEVGFDVEELFRKPLAKFLQLGLLERSGDVVRLTRAGLLISDAMWPELLTPATKN